MTASKITLNPRPLGVGGRANCRVTDRLGHMPRALRCMRREARQVFAKGHDFSRRAVVWGKGTTSVVPLKGRPGWGL